MKDIILQSVHDENLFANLNPTSANTLDDIVYYTISDYDYNDKLLLYTQDNKTLYLCKKEEEVENSQINENYTKIGRRKIFGDYSQKSFAKFKVYSKFKLKRKIHFPESDKTYHLNKPIHEKLHSELLQITSKHLEISEYLKTDEEVEDGYLPYKVKGRWGFLFYERHDEDYKFTFEFVNNVMEDGTRLIQSQEGYKDFTYFIRSQALPKAFKIGRADNPDKRFKAIQAHNARDVVTDLLLADGRLETYYHNKYDHLRISDSREWFEIGNDLQEFVTKEKRRITRIFNQFEKSKCKKDILSKN